MAKKTTKTTTSPAKKSAPKPKKGLKKVDTDRLERVAGARSDVTDEERTINWVVDRS